MSGFLIYESKNIPISEYEYLCEVGIFIFMEF